MKSFSSASFASDHGATLASAQAAVERHPQALFTDFQWFLFEGRDTVFFSAFTEIAFDSDGLTNLVADMVALAPQLTHGFVGARPGQPFPKHLLDAITSLEYVDELDGYPDKWLGKSEDIFTRADLPLFRVMAAVRRDGPDAEGRAAVIQVRSAHALMEGSDSALLTRSQNAAHGIMSDRSSRLDFSSRWRSRLSGWMMTWSGIVIANLFAPPEQPWGFRTLAIPRHRLKALASRLGVRQRSLYFALVTFALNGEGPQKHLDRKVIAAAYTMIDSRRFSSDDDFFRVRALAAKFRVNDDFIAFVRAIDDTVARIEQKDITRYQVAINTMFGMLRRLNAITRRLPGKRYWRFNAGFDIVLTLVPPHRTYGPMTHGMVEPIYCGAWHPATNIATFCPGRQYLTLNFSMEQRHLANVERIMPLLEEIEARDITPGDRLVVEDEPV